MLEVLLHQSMKASWEEEFDKIWNKDRFEEIGFTFSDFEFVKQFIRKQLAKQREELLERIREEVLIEDIGSDVVADTCYCKNNDWK